jgi:hypothetical protein
MNPCHPSLSSGVPKLQDRPGQGAGHTRNGALCLRVFLFSAANQHLPL